MAPSTSLLDIPLTARFGGGVAGGILLPVALI